MMLALKTIRTLAIKIISFLGAEHVVDATKAAQELPERLNKPDAGKSSV
jgi:hypothetical protein